ADVYHGKNTLDAFVAQMSDDDLAALCCGEGMNSPKATPGTGGALGGQTASLSALGMPVCCVTDGPSGVRLDSGEKASSIPNGTLLACTWDTDLVEELYGYISEELARYHVDALLGPGINIHRHPLCGRHFEYFSEDPFLTGKLAAAVTKGVAKCGAFATIKHFCCNNQETNRYGCESVVSERALRELYLKPFEIAVKEGENVLIMTAYNPVNGYWTAVHYDLTATVLRGEWGFDNFVMTDWWAKCNLSCGSDGNGALLQAMVRAKGDVYMVCQDAQNKAQSILDGLRDGYITRGELQDCAKRLCDWILRSITFKEYLANGCVPKYPVVRDTSTMHEVATWTSPQAGEAREFTFSKGALRLAFTLSCDADVLAQMPVTVKVGEEVLTFSVCGTNGAPAEAERFIDLAEDGTYTVSVSHADVVCVSQLKMEQ
ncbi:MAG: beta-glucosidase, partial [Clostridia bacterium]|nr:beta-glucosidase [Clostridia bacterium]